MKTVKWLATAACIAATSGCSGVVLYADGPVREYVQQPIPTPTTSVARTASLSMATWHGDAGTLYCDMRATPIGTVQSTPLPAKFKEELFEALQLDEPYADAGTRAAFDVIVYMAHPGKGLQRAFRKAKRHDEGAPGQAAHAESLAAVATSQGDRATAHAYASAAKMRMKAAQGKKAVHTRAARALEGAGGSFSSLDEQYRRSWEWLQEGSGAVGPEAPEGTHLDVFVLELQDGGAFQIDSRSRIAVLMILVDADGETTSILRGSDFAVCKDECTSIERKPSLEELKLDGVHDEVEQKLLSGEGFKALNQKGFHPPYGHWEYLLLEHALADLAKAAGSAPAPATASRHSSSASP